MTMTLHTPFTDHYDRTFLLETMMGPNAMRITEEMAAMLLCLPVCAFWISVAEKEFPPSC